VPRFFQDRLSDSRKLDALGISRDFIASTMDYFIRTRREEHCRRLWALLVLDRSVARLSEVSAHE
jgi:hypothetical protein